MKQSTFYGKMDSIRKAAINAAATVISAPAVIKSKMDQAESNNDFKVLKEANERRNEPKFNTNGTPTRGFMARTASTPIKAKLNMRSMPGKTQQFLKKAISKGQARFEDNKEGGEYIYSADKSFGKKK